MSAQSSYFMVWGSKKEPLEKILSDEKYLMNIPEKETGMHTYGIAQQEEILFHFDIHADRKQHLLRELDIVGINVKTLFPGLDGIGKYIERKSRFDYNEVMSL